MFRPVLEILLHTQGIVDCCLVQWTSGVSTESFLCAEVVFRRGADVSLVGYYARAMRPRPTLKR